jgi:hypothetical protein
MIAAEGTEQIAASPREIMMRFESLGENCEFGIVQRAHKAEPLGLFRWASANLQAVTAALAARFEGLGDPKCVRIRLVNGEYMADETRYRLTYHTFAKEGELTAEALHEREFKRLRYLAGKLAEDLEEAEKIFVCKRDRALTEAEIAPLYRALREYGPNTLLWVVPSSPHHAAGNAEWLGDGLMRGYIDHFADPDRVPATTSVGVWTNICTNALQLRRERAKRR